MSAACPDEYIFPIFRARKHIVRVLIRIDRANPTLADAISGNLASAIAGEPPLYDEEFIKRSTDGKDGERVNQVNTWSIVLFNALEEISKRDKETLEYWKATLYRNIRFFREFPKELLD